jgi:hypothetical protein
MEVDKVAMPTADFIIANDEVFGIVDLVQAKFL